MQAYYRAKNASKDMNPTFQTLGERMSQGGKQKHDHPHGLAQQMEQGGGYTQSRPKATLGDQMGQRSR